MSRQTLIDMARHNMGYAKDGTVEQTDEILHIPVEHYYDTKRWAAGDGPGVPAHAPGRRFHLRDVRARRLPSS